MLNKRILQLGIMVTVALLLIATTVRSQAPVRAAQVWEYSTVSGAPQSHSGTLIGINLMSWNSKATICYATAQGCRLEDVDTTSQSNGPEAMMMAVAKLGEQGWELTTSTEYSTDTRHERTLYFRRLKSDAK